MMTIYEHGIVYVWNCLLQNYLILMNILLIFYSCNCNLSCTIFEIITFALYKNTVKYPIICTLSVIYMLLYNFLVRKFMNVTFQCVNLWYLYAYSFDKYKNISFKSILLSGD